MLILYYSYVRASLISRFIKENFSGPKINKPTTRLCIHDLAESHGLNKMCFTSNLCEKSLWRQKFVTNFLKTGQQKFLEIYWRYCLSFFCVWIWQEKRSRLGKIATKLGRSATPAISAVCLFRSGNCVLLLFFSVILVSIEVTLMFEEPVLTYPL